MAGAEAKHTATWGMNQWTGDPPLCKDQAWVCFCRTQGEIHGLEGVLNFSSRFLLSIWRNVPKTGTYAVCKERKYIQELREQTHVGRGEEWYGAGGRLVG